MEEQFDCYDGLRYELFEVLLPQMLYKGTEIQKEEFFNTLLSEGKDFIREMYNALCEDDKLPYPYKKEDFEVETLERGGVNLLKISLPPYNPAINDILRAYLLFMRKKNDKICIKYFVIKRFANGNIFNLYVTPKGEIRLGEELTEHIGDMEYEYWKLVSDYSKIIILDMQEEERRKHRRKSKDKNKIENAEKWSKDWGNFDWGVVREKLTEAEKKIEKGEGTKEQYDIGITEEELIEYLQWLNENNPKEYERAMLCLDLKQRGMEEQQIELLLSHPEEVKQAIAILERENRIE